MENEFGKIGEYVIYYLYDHYIIYIAKSDSFFQGMGIKFNRIIPLFWDNSSLKKNFIFHDTTNFIRMELLIDGKVCRHSYSFIEMEIFDELNVEIGRLLYDRMTSIRNELAQHPLRLTAFEL